MVGDLKSPFDADVKATRKQAMETMPPLDIYIRAGGDGGDKNGGV